ncbi:MAG: hypothetical protein A3I77_01405 [Gammaproteobacteria bacterium RIFCSPLOWO2_02_FULL_42_14]|nr:MAG: hypothetical protein A3B71_07590 [Gammaproteobacteria bacterium RIFCSPHIGHO2_02_FULL_42_43]OGT29211.1 MAG: hypothetical protein A2624_07165 [Gammaproteobacteria bacterium RIFCSPHIGHO2_01_FULL_42_8]OGT52284.1 MAG: hypothetical protein A3E54_01465 [Gammaproteobacteria bacterium RIFCSPHIGHO2_12_FULL_41_25]OGT61897.1 MAG: hypothetical protein A3I77_01405 [Gammaproteobacteria bacterium RIFCSPLOWO2_02_FULL_42_14]OGT86393.1 MAG: hypothetical protein A3G86_07690 [Gammaproteobacteria bacterium R
MNKKYFFAAWIFLFATPVFSQDSSPINVGFSYEQYRMPQGLPDLGVLGIHALIDFSSWCYGGLVGYEGVAESRDTHLHD